MAAPSAFKFRLYPNRKQEERMLAVIQSCRRLWNIALEDRQATWVEDRRSTNYYQQCLMLTIAAKENPWMRCANMQTLQEVLKRLDRAFQKFFRGETRLPRFKRRREWGSFTYPEAYNRNVKLDQERGRIWLSKVGNVRVVVHRPIPAARMKACTVKREPDGKWYACLVYDGQPPPSQRARLVPERSSPIGIDLGLKALITTSDGEEVEAPKFLRRSEKRLARLQRRFSKKVRGSKNQAKARMRLAKLHSKVSAQRQDFHHKLSSRLVRDHSLIAFEDLRIENMMRNRRLAKSIKDASWGQLVEFTEHKAALAGRTCVKVPAAFTTQECWFCGTRNQVPLGVWRFTCDGCGRLLARDRNAGRIVLKRGLLQVGWDKNHQDSRPAQENPGWVARELKPVESEPLPPRSTEVASSVDEAGTRCGDTPLKAHALRVREDVTRQFDRQHSEGGGGCHKAAALPQSGSGVEPLRREIAPSGEEREMSRERDSHGGGFSRPPF